MEDHLPEEVQLQPELPDLTVLPQPFRYAAEVLTERGPIGFAVVAAAYMYLPMTGVFLVGWALSGTPPLGPPTRYPLGWVVWVMTVKGPLVETLLFVALPVFVGRLFTKRPWPLVVICTVVVAIAQGALRHVVLMIEYAAMGGILGFTFVWWSRRSWWKAYCLTSFAHALFNTAALLATRPFGRSPFL